MKKFILLFLVACTPATIKQDVKDALSFAQIACILASPSLNSEEVMQVCNVVNDAYPVVSRMMVNKAQAMKAERCQ